MNAMSFIPGAPGADSAASNLSAAGSPAVATQPTGSGGVSFESLLEQDVDQGSGAAASPAPYAGTNGLPAPKRTGTMRSSLNAASAAPTPDRRGSATQTAPVAASSGGSAPVDGISAGRSNKTAQHAPPDAAEETPPVQTGAAHSLTPNFSAVAFQLMSAPPPPAAIGLSRLAAGTADGAEAGTDGAGGRKTSTKTAGSGARSAVTGNSSASAARAAAQQPSSQTAKGDAPAQTSDREEGQGDSTGGGAGTYGGRQFERKLAAAGGSAGAPGLPEGPQKTQANFASGQSKAASAPAAPTASSDKVSLPSGLKSDTNPISPFGTSGAPPGAMPHANAPHGSVAFTVAAGFAPRGTEAAGSAASASAAAQNAVDSVMKIADAQAAAGETASSSVNLGFDFGGEHLAVRVEMKNGQVHTQFSTSSSELRAAVASQWSSMTNSGGQGQGQRSYHFAQPQFTSGGSDGDTGSSGGSFTSHGGFQNSSGADGGWSASLAASRSSAADQPAQPAETETPLAAAGSLHLNALA